MGLSLVELEPILSPHKQLEYKEFCESTDLFRKWIREEKGNNELTNKEIFILISDDLKYQARYQEFLSEPDVRTCLRIFLATDPSIIEDKFVIKIMKSWRLL